MSCSTTDTNPSTSSAETSGVLSNLYTPTSFNVPDDYNLLYNAIPYYDNENETVTVCSKKYKEVQTEDGVIEEISSYWLDTFALSGELIRSEQIPLSNDVFSISHVIITNYSLIYRGNSHTYRLDRTTGETISTEESTDLYEEEDFNIFFTAADDEGRFYYTDKYTVYVLNPDLSFAFSLDFPTAVYTMARGGDGAVWVTFNTGFPYAAKIDPQTQELGQYYTFTRGNDTLDGTQHYLLNTAMADAGDAFGYDFYYCDKDTVWGVRVGEDGSLTEETLIDLVNSGIGELYSGYDEGSNVYGIAFLTDEYLMTMELLSGHISLGGQKHSVPVLCHKSEDIALDSIQTVTIAHAYALDTMTIKQITSFNRENPGVQIVALDYSVYATEENPSAGEEKLCFDLVNGYVTPDIVVTSADIQTISDGMVMSQLCKNNLYVDLVPYLEQDDTVNFDTLFGCIPQFFDDGKGGMWGIATDFQFFTLIGDSERLSEYTEKEKWTFAEMLDYFESFPDGSEMLYQYYLLQSQCEFFAEGYSYFIKNSECSFTSDEFLSFLDFLTTLPENRAEWSLVSPFPELAMISYAERQEALTAAFDTEMLALYPYGVYTFTFLDLLRSDEFFPIGYATQNTSGVRISADYAYSITVFADDPDLCFEIIKHFFEGVIFEDIYRTEWPFFALKPQFEKAIEVATDPEALFSDTYTPFTEEEFVKLYDLLDNSGSPILEKTPTAVQEIIEEELSAYLAGMGTAEDCAEKIQSRVEIWIAEHE